MERRQFFPAPHSSRFSAAHDNRAWPICKEKIATPVYKIFTLGDTRFVSEKACDMAQSKNRQETRLQELIVRANAMNVYVRKEKLLREAGYRVHSGRCRINGREVIILDRDAPIADQIEFLAGELSEPSKPPVTASAPAEVTAAE
jgi:hypothetical protein